MKKLLFLFIYAFAAVAVAQTNTTVQTNTPVPIQRIEIDGYAAKVNDRVITISDVRLAMAPLLQEIHRTYQGAELDMALQKAFEQVRDDLIDQALILEFFKEKGGQIPDQYVEDEVRRVINDRFKGNEAQFEQLLATERKSRDEYKETIRDQMIVSMMMNQEVTQRARVTPEEIRHYYEQHKDDQYFIPNKVRHSAIAINKGETPEEQAIKLEEAQLIRQKLLDGADFAETAKESSEGSRAAEGGQFPWMQPADVREELRDVLETLPAGEISDIIETEKQYFIIKLDARRQAGYRSFEEVRDEIKNALMAQEKQRLRERWLDRLKAQYYVKIYED